MNNQYFSRIYFSRYFYSSFKSTLKTRIKITSNAEYYFYSDPYYFNFRQKKNVMLFKVAEAPNLFPVRSYFFSTLFQLHTFGNKYDLSWQVYSAYSNFLSKIFPIFIKLKIFNFYQFNFTKIYLAFFSKNIKLW